jgi:hypothetical protein
MSRAVLFAIHFSLCASATDECPAATRTPDGQADALRAAGCDEVLVDKASGKLARRLELDKVLLRMRAGDQLVITKLDRLGRSLDTSSTCTTSPAEPNAPTTQRTT